MEAGVELRGFSGSLARCTPSYGPIMSRFRRVFQKFWENIKLPLEGWYRMATVTIDRSLSTIFEPGLCKNVLRFVGMWKILPQYLHRNHNNEFRRSWFTWVCSCLISRMIGSIRYRSVLIVYWSVLITLDRLIYVWLASHSPSMCGLGQHHQYKKLPPSR